MKKIILLISLVYSGLSTVCAQSTYNRWSADGNFGLNSALGEFAEGYMSNYLTYFHMDAGARYSFTNKLGAIWDIGFDRVKNDEIGNNGFLEEGKSKEFETHYFRTSLQLVMNVGRVYEIENIYEDLGLLMHFGIGFSSLKDSKNSVWFKPWKTQGTDEMMNFIFGLRPQYRLNDDISVHMDLTMVLNMWQSKTWDFTENNFKKDLHGKLFNISVGASYYFGENQKHLDWVILPGGRSTYMGSDTIKRVETIRTIETTKVRGHETDTKEKDSIPEIDDPEGDFDGDGILNKNDACPTTYGEDPNGCSDSDRDGDGIKNEVDECPDLAGVKENHGCPDLGLKTKMTLNNAKIGVEFVDDDDEILEECYPLLDEVVQLLNEHPEYDMKIEGHTDNFGEEGPLMALSKGRAKAVYDYLISQGIAPERLSHEGYGHHKPLASNEHPAGRKQNNRVEFKVIFR